jgi:hypothetical protein
LSVLSFEYVRLMHNLPVPAMLGSLGQAAA